MNQFITSLLVLACLTSVYSSGCAVKSNTIELFPSINEKMQWNLIDGIFQGEDLTFSITDNVFKIQKPLEITGGSSSHIKPSDSIRAAKPLHTKKMQSWLNSFVFLTQGQTEVSIYFAEGNSLDKIPTPNFQTKIKIADVIDNLQCYDIEFIDSDKYLIDCQKQITDKGKLKLIDVFYIYSKAQNKVTLFEEESFDKIYNKRIIGLFYTTSVTGKESTYIVRITPTYSLTEDSQFSNNSLVSVYILNDNFTITSTNYILDNVTMALLLGKSEMELNIVDVEISYNGFIFLLDAQHGLFVIQFKPTGSWELFAQADLQTGQLFAFDIDFEHKKDGSELGVMAILGYDFFAILDADKSYVQKLPFFQFDYPTTIKMTENHVIVRNNEYAYIYTLDIEDKGISLLTKLQLTQNDWLLVNPYEPDIVQINARNSYRYTVSSGLLKYEGHTATQAQKTFTLKATAPNKQECSVFVMYQIVENNENWIYELPTNPTPFPNTISEVPTYQHLKRLASGPNLQYALNGQSNVAVEVETRIELDVNEWPEDVIYAEILSTESHTEFYQILQTKDFRMQIWFCVHSSLFNDDTICEIYVNDLNIGYQANKNNFSIWLKHDIIYFIQQDNAMSLSIKTIKNHQIFVEKQIQLEDEIEIVSILNCGEYLLILKDDDTISSYLTYRPETFALATINKQTFSQYGYDKDWEPVALFTNKKLHPNLVFIQHKTHILMLDTDYGLFSFIKHIDITPGLQYEIAIGQTTFFLVQGKSAADKPDAKIYEYNFESINNVYQSKELYLFWYDISLPLQVDYSEESGLMFVRGVCLYCAKSFIIAFQPNVLLHDVLVQAWPIAENVVDEKIPIVMAVNGIYQTYLYLNILSEQWLTSVFDQPTIAIQAKIDSLEYAVNQDLELKIRNYNFQNKPEKFNTIQIKQAIRAISTQSTIKFDSNKFTPAKDGIQILDTEKSKTVQLGTEWYQGQIGVFEIDCDQCETNISLTSTVDLIQSKLFNGYEIRSYVQYNDQYNILQATRGLLFLNTDNTLASVYDFDLPHQQYKCFQASVSKDKMVVYSLCHDGQEYTIYATGCFSITGCSPLGEKFKLGTASKIQVVDNEVLVVLHTDALNPEENTGEIIIYQIVMTLDAWRLEVLDVFNLNTLNSRLSTQIQDFRPSDFSVVQQQLVDINTNSYKLFIVDSLSGFMYIDFTLTNLAVYQYQYIETLNLHQFLNNDVNQYTLSTTRFLSFEFIFEPIYDWSSRMLRTYILVVSSDTTHYGIKVYFTQKGTYTQMETKGICSLINRHGWKALNKISIHRNQYLAIPYMKDKEIVVGIYDFDIDVFGDKTIKPAVMIGSYRLYVSEEQWVHPLNMAMFFHNGNQKTLFVSQFSGALSSLSINKEPVLNIDNKDKSVEDQIITISAKNDFSHDSIQFQLTFQGTDAKECVPIKENVSVNPSSGETILWDLSQNFFDGLALKYTINSNDFTVTQPTTQIGQSQNHVQNANQISSAKALLTPNQAWTNQFAFLNKNNDKYHLFYTKTATLNQAPSFTELYTIQKQENGQNCYDFVQLSQTIFTVDCQVNENKFLILIQDGKETYTTNIKNTQINRRLGTYAINDNHFVIRVTLSISNEGDLANDSFVELFQLSNNQLVYKDTLDKTKLEQITKKTINQLNIVDFKVGSNGAIYLLDAKWGIFVVNYDTTWRFQRLITYSISQSYAFDREVLASNQEQFVILSYNYYAVINENGRIVKIQDLTQHYLSYPQSISFSQEFVYLYNQAKLYVYHSDSKDTGIVDIIKLTNGAFIVNPFASEIVTLTLADSSRWFISLGSLTFTGTAQAFVTPKTLTISATSVNHISCQTTLQYSVLASNSQALLKKTTTDTPLPDVVNEYEAEMFLGDFVSGPNLEYTVTKSEEDVFQEVVLFDKLNAPIFQNSTIYQAEFVGQINTQILYQVIQTEDKKLHFYKCIFRALPQPNCFEDANITVGLTQSDQWFSIWDEDNSVIKFYALETPFSVNFYKLENSKISKEKTISFTTDEGNQILSILNQGKFVSILQQNGQITTYDGTYKAIVTGATLTGFTGNWKPIKLFGNMILKPNVIFVQNEDNVVIMNYVNNEHFFVKKMDYTKNNQIFIALAKETFFMINNSELMEFNYSNLLNIYKIQTVELYDYQIALPLVASTQLATGNLLLKTTMNQNIYLNTYKAGKPKHETFYYGVQTDGFTKQNPFKLSSAGTTRYLYAFLNSETTQQFYFLELNAILVVQTNLKKEIFSQNHLVELKISNKDTEQAVTYNQTIKVVNTYAHLLLNNDNYLNTLEIDGDDCPQEYLIDNDWILGHIQDTKLTLSIPTDDLSLVPYAKTSQSLLNTHHFTSAISQNSNTFLQTHNNILYYKDQDVANAKSLLPNLSDQYYCFYIEQFENTLLYSLCSNGVLNQIQITNCDAQLKCQREDTYISVPNAVQIIALEKDYVAILHSDTQNPEYVDGSVVIYKLTKQDNMWFSTALLNIDYQFIKEKLATKAPKNFKPSSIQISKFEAQSSNYQLIITDSENGLLFLDFNIDAQISKVSYIYSEFLDLKQWLNQNQQYAADKAIFYQAKIINQATQNKLKTVDLVVVTDISASYLLKLVFTYQDNNSNKLTTTSTSVVFNRYGKFTALNSLVATNSIVAIPYQQNNQVVISFYQLSQTHDGYKVLATNGAHSFTTESQPLNPQDFFMLVQKDTVITSTGLNGLYVNQLSSQLVLKFGDPNKLHDQMLKLSFENNYSSIEREIQLKVKTPVVNEECKTKLTNFKIYPSTGETLVWPLTQSIFEGVSLKYTINQMTDFTVTQSLAQIGQSQNHVQNANQISSAKALLTPNQAWTNQFAFLNKNNDKYHLFYTKTANLNEAPSFTELYTIQKQENGQNCYDFVQLSQTIFTVDCSYNNNNVLILIQDGKETYVTNATQTIQANRRLGTYSINDNHFVIRVTLSISNEGDLANDSFVELFQLSNNQLVYKDTLDKTKLIDITKKNIDQLNIVDFKVGQNGAIYLLDAKLGIFVVNYDTTWMFKRFISYKTGQTYAFDRSVQSKDNSEIFTLRCYNYFVIIDNQGKIIKVQDLPASTLSYPQRIKLSQQYVFVTIQSKLLIYHADESSVNLIDNINIANSAPIINPIDQDLVLVTLSDASIWSFSQGLLQFNQQAQPTQQFKELVITATSQHKQVCLSKINYQIIAKASQTVIKNVDTDEPLPSVLDENNEQIKLGSLVSGPNLQYKLGQVEKTRDKFLYSISEPEKDVEISIVQSRNIKVPDWPMKTKYQTSLILNDERTLYQVFQNENDKITIHSCHFVEHTNYNCTEIASESVHTELNDQLFSIWQENDGSIGFITVDTLYIIKGFSIKDNKTQLEYIINLSKDVEDENKQVVSFVNQENIIFVLQKNGDLSSYVKVNKVSSFSQQLSGYNAKWNPVKLYNNRILKPNILFVQNEDNLAIFNYFNNEFIYVSLIDIDAQSQVFVSLSSNTFFVIINQSLDEYNYEYLNKIYKQKSVELFGYQIANPLTVTTQIATGNLIIKTVKDEKTYLNVYKSEQTQLNTFYMALLVDKVELDNKFSLSSGGSSYIISLINSEKFQQCNMILLDPELIVVPNKKKHIYISKQNVQITIKNADSTNNEVTFKQTIKVVNTFINLLVNDEKQLKSIEIKPKTNSTNVLIDNEWITGQLPYYSFTAQNHTEITFSPYLAKTNEKLLIDRQFKAAVTFKKQLMLQATNNILYVKDGDLKNAKALFKTDLDSNFNCFAIEAFSNTLYSLCNNGVETQIQVVTCDDKVDCKRQDAYISATQAIQLIALQENVVALLHTDSSNPEEVDGTITIHKLTSEDDIWSASLLFTINYSFIKDKMGAQSVASFRPSSFQVSKTGEDNDQSFIQLLITDSVNGLLSFDISLSKTTSEVKYLYLEYLLLNKWLNENEQYASDSTHYYAGQIVEQSIKESKKTITLAMVTDNASSYMFDLQFTVQENKSNKLTQTKVTQTLNRYGNWKAINKIVANNNAVLVSYQNDGDVLVGVYQIYKEQSVQVIHGSFTHLIGDTFEPVDLLLHLQDKQLIASNKGKGINQYQITEQMQISFGNSTLLSNQTLSLLMMNDYQYVTKEISLTIIPDNDDNKGSSSNAWWITLIAVGALLGFGLVGLFCWKKRKATSQEEDQEGYNPIN